MSELRGALAVVSQSGQTLSFFDLVSGQRTAQLGGLLAEPHELCFDEGRNLLYVSHTYAHGHFWTHGDYAHEISVIDCTTKTCVDVINVTPALGPHGLVLDKHTGTLYASVEELEKGMGGGLIGIDLRLRRVIKTIESKSKPHWFVMTPDGRKAYTCNKTQSFISVLDLEKGSYLGRIDIPSCEEPGISPDGKLAYFPTPGLRFGVSPADASVQVIDTATDKVVNSFSTDLGIQSVHVTASSAIMVAHYSFDPRAPATAPKALEGRLAMHSADTFALLGETTVDVAPLTLRSTADGKTAFVANIFKGTVSIVDLTGMTVTRTLNVDITPNPAKTFHQGAHGMALIR